MIDERVHMRTAYNAVESGEKPARSERAKPEPLEPELDRLRAELAEAERSKREHAEPEIKRLKRELDVLTTASQRETQDFRRQLLFYAEQSDLARRRATIVCEELAASTAKELERRAERVAALELEKQDWWDPELERRAQQIAELERKKEEWWDPELARRARRIEELEQLASELTAVRGLAAQSVSEVLRSATRWKRFRSGLMRSLLDRGRRVKELPFNSVTLAALLRASGLFDAPWYSARNPDVAASRSPPLEHYIVWGCKEERSPGPNFDAAAYLRHYPDVKASGIPALFHYLVYGLREGRSMFRAADTN